MKRGHCTGLKREKKAATPQFDAIQSAHLARIEAELAAKQAAQATSQKGDHAMRFTDLALGDTFAFQPARVCPDRILRCRKIASSRYAFRLPSGRLQIETICTTNTPVYQEGLTGISNEV